MASESAFSLPEIEQCEETQEKVIVYESFDKALNVDRISPRKYEECITGLERMASMELRLSIKMK